MTHNGHHQSESCSGCTVMFYVSDTSCCGCHETNIAPDATPLQSQPRLRPHVPKIRLETSLNSTLICIHIFLCTCAWICSTCVHGYFLQPSPLWPHVLCQTPGATVPQLSQLHTPCVHSVDSTQTKKPLSVWASKEITAHWVWYLLKHLPFIAIFTFPRIKAT